MSENAELHQKILGFLMAEWARKDNRQLVAVALLYSPLNGFKDEEIRTWIRADQPELFADFGTLEKIVSDVIEIAEGEANAKPAGKHRFVVRCHQHAGSRPYISFSLSPTYNGTEESLMIGGGGGGGGPRDQHVIAGHASQLMRINAQMFEGTIRVLGQQNMNLHQQVATLTAENATLRKELEEARSNKMDREFQIAMAAEKNARTNAGFQKILQLGTVAIAKLGAGTGPGNDAAAMAGSPLGMLLGELFNSLRPEQRDVIFGALDMPQKIMFMEIVNMVRPPEPPNQGNAAPGAPSP
jgi:hypothetical protein